MDRTARALGLTLAAGKASWRAAALKKGPERDRLDVVADTARTASKELLDEVAGRRARLEIAMGLRPKGSH